MISDAAPEPAGLYEDAVWGPGGIGLRRAKDEGI